MPQRRISRQDVSGGQVAEPSSTDRSAQGEIARRLGEAGFALPGSYLVHAHVCGKPNCRCMADPPRPHGPYHQWTRKVDGKTTTLRLSEEQARIYGPWFQEAQRLRALLSELETLSLGVAQRDVNGL
ncbi:MAG: DUF6788 family protein [Actinomycetota bacterium]